MGKAFTFRLLSMLLWLFDEHLRSLHGFSTVCGPRKAAPDIVTLPAALAATRPKGGYSAACAAARRRSYSASAALRQRARSAGGRSG